MIYTSGTTGHPKGVMIEHQGVVNLALMKGKEFKLINSKEAKHCLWYSNYVFDAHVWEIYTSVLNGNVIHIVGNHIRQDINLLASYIEHNKIYFALIPPALLNENNVLQVKVLLVGGDITKNNIIKKHLNANVKVINAYGPTETTVMCSTHLFANGEEFKNIGTPISNAKCYVLDNNLNPLPIGGIGELYVGGTGLARGYLNQAELTEERFIPNPFQTEAERRDTSYGEKGRNARLYKTGDLVRWLPDGNLEYIGRNDFQVKIRGYRIELGEIENALSSYEGVKQSVVLAKERTSPAEETSGNKYLVGYYV